MTLFETERLLVRRLTDADVPAMRAIYGDRETVRYVGDSEPIDEAGCREWVAVTDRNFARRSYGMVALEEKATGEVIGFAGIVHPGQQEQPEAKYAFRRDKWGQGFATEAIVGLVNHARRCWGVSRVIATVFPENLPSQNVLSKAGFRHLEDEQNEDGSITQIWELVTP